jgi:hypothetical protein
MTEIRFTSLRDAASHEEQLQHNAVARLTPASCLLHPEHLLNLTSNSSTLVFVLTACVPGLSPFSGWTRLSTRASSHPLIRGSVDGSLTSATTCNMYSTIKC